MTVQSDRATPPSLTARSTHTQPHTRSLETVFLHSFLTNSTTHSNQSLHFSHEPAAASRRRDKIVLLSRALELKK